MSQESNKNKSCNGNQDLSICFCKSKSKDNTEKYRHNCLWPACICNNCLEFIVICRCCNEKNRR